MNISSLVYSLAPRVSIFHFVYSQSKSHQSIQHQLEISMSHHPEYTMGALLTMGGAYGYYKKKSMPSLIGGLVLGLGYFTSGYLIHQKYEYDRGHYLAAGCAAVLSATGLVRFFKTRAFMPGGMLAILGLSSLATEFYFLSKY